jgi:ribosomal-protein-alanine N-acetyltransferase
VPSNNAVRIRHATPDDVPEIRRLEEQASTASHWATEQYDAVFAQDAPQRIVLVAESDHQDRPVVGFVIARCLADEWEIENIVVADGQRQHGIGSALVSGLLSGAKAAAAVSVILEVRESNAPARRLYESIGFTSEGRRKGYYRDPVEDAILYRRSLQFCDKIS